MAQAVLSEWVRVPAIHQECVIVSIALHKNASTMLTVRAEIATSS